MHEAAHRYELVATLGGPATRCWIGGGALAHARKRQGEGRRRHGYAAEHGYVVLTHHLDFSAILSASQGGSPSVAQIRAEGVGPQAIGAHVVAALRKAEADLDAGALLTIDPSRARLRLLPLPRKSEEAQ